MKVALAWIDLDDPTDRVVALGVAGGLRRRGLEVVIVGPRRRLGSARREEVDGFSVFRVGHPLLEGVPFLADAWAAIELFWLNKCQRPHLWHCHIFGRRHRALSWAAGAGGWPLLASLHLVLPDYLPAAGGRRSLSALLRRAFHVTAASRASLDQARLLFPEIDDRCSVVWYGISSSDGALASSYPLPSRPYALCASRLAPYKGLDILLMAFARMRERRHDLQLVLCGRDQTRGGLSRFAGTLGLQDDVLFAGELPRPDVSRLLENCLFFAIPSRRENLPLALLEAMAAGKPAVAARVGGVPELVSHGQDGLLVEPGDVEGLADAMTALASNAELRENLGRRARQRCSIFDWDRAAQSYAELYAAAR